MPVMFAMKFKGRIEQGLDIKKYYWPDDQHLLRWYIKKNVPVWLIVVPAGKP